MHWKSVYQIQSFVIMPAVYYKHDNNSRVGSIRDTLSGGQWLLSLSLSLSLSAAHNSRWFSWLYFCVRHHLQAAAAAVQVSDSSSGRDLAENGARWKMSSEKEKAPKTKAISGQSLTLDMVEGDDGSIAFWCDYAHDQNMRHIIHAT
jgi:hypothetical protein